NGIKYTRCRCRNQSTFPAGLPAQKMKKNTFADWLERWPLVAILRGIKPGEALDIGAVLVKSGFCIIEVPLNSPEPYASIIRLAKRFGDQVLVGAGTVTDWEQVSKVGDAGGRVIVMPHAAARAFRGARVRHRHRRVSHDRSRRRRYQALPRRSKSTESAKGVARSAAKKRSAVACRRHRSAQHERLLGGRCRRFRAGFCALQSRRYAGPGRAGCGGFSLRGACSAEADVKAIPAAGNGFRP